MATDTFVVVVLLLIAAVLLIEIVWHLRAGGRS